MTKLEKAIQELLEVTESNETLTDVLETLDGNIVEFDGMEYLVLDEENQYLYLDEHLQETASYFNPDFLANMTDLPEEIFIALEDKNEAVYKLIEKTCGIEEFIEDMIQIEGAGHFLSSYDGNEIELQNGDYFAYRIN